MQHLLIQTLIVGLGGFVGAVLRFWIGLALAPKTAGEPDAIGEPAGIAWATLGANAIGCLAIGVAIAYAHTRGGWPEWVRLGVIVGLLGSLTTFSAFAGETVTLVRDGRIGLAIGLVAGQLISGIGLAAIGLVVGTKLFATPTV